MNHEFEALVHVTFFPSVTRAGHWNVYAAALDCFYFAVMDDFGNLVRVPS